MDVIGCLRHIVGKSVPGPLFSGSPGIMSQILNACVSYLAGQYVLLPHVRAVFDAFTGMRLDHAIELLRFELEEFDVWGPGRVTAEGVIRENTLKKDEECAKLLTMIEEELQRVRGAPFIEGEVFQRRLAQLFTLRAWALIWLERFDDACLALSRAEGVLHTEHLSHRFLLSIVCWRYAEVKMRDADCEVRIDEMDTGNQLGRPRIASANSKLTAAEAFLGDAEKLLRGGKQNVSQWRRLYTSKVQLQIERLQLLLVSGEVLERGSSFVGVVHTCLRRGLEAIRGGWDCLSYERGESEYGKKERKGLVFRWLELMVGGALSLWMFGKLQSGMHLLPSNENEAVVRLREAVISERPLIELGSFKARWLWLNRAVGLERFAKHANHWEGLLSEALGYAQKGGIEGHPKFGGRCWLRQLGFLIVELWAERDGAKLSKIDVLVESLWEEGNELGEIEARGGRSTGRMSGGRIRTGKR